MADVIDQVFQYVLIVGIPCAIGLTAWEVFEVLRGRKPEPADATPPRPLPPTIPDDVAALIRRLGDADTRKEPYDALAELGTTAVPHLITAHPTADPATRGEIACLLGRIGDVQARPLLEELVAKGAPEWYAALSGAVSFGTADAARLALAALDPERRAFPWLNGSLARGAVYLGIQEAAEYDRVTPEFRDALLLPVLRCVGESWGGDRPSAADAVIHLDRAVAARLLQSPEVLDRGPDAIRTAFAAIVDEGLTVDPDVAMSWANRHPVRPAASRSEALSLQALLLALAASRHPAARERIEAFRSIPDQMTRRAAINALVSLEGIRNAAAVVLDRVAEVGVAGLTGPQRTYHLAWPYLNATSHSEWLTAHAESDAADVEAALRTIGATGAADLLAEARRRYASLRIRARTTGVADDAYIDFDERLVAESWAALDLLTEHALRHAADFRTPAA